MSEPLANGTTAVVPLAVVSTVVKRSVSFPADVYAALEEQALVEGVSISALVTAGARHVLGIADGLRAVAEFEAEYGPFSPEEVAEADRWAAEAWSGAESSCEG